MYLYQISIKIYFAVVCVSTVSVWRFVPPNHEASRLWAAKKALYHIQARDNKEEDEDTGKIWYWCFFYTSSKMPLTPPTSFRQYVKKNSGINSTPKGSLLSFYWFPLDKVSPMMKVYSKLTEVRRGLTMEELQGNGSSLSPTRWHRLRLPLHCII